jgi:hypothetical protein
MPLWLWASSMPILRVLICLPLSVFFAILLVLWIWPLSSILMGVPYGVPASVGGFLQNCAVSDADGASDELDRKSISGCCFYFLNSLVSWTKQRAISLSSTDAEYYSMTHAIKEALWIHLFLSLNSLPVPRPFPLLSDNQSACSLANNPNITSCSKHIDICHHFIREHIANGTFCMNWIPTSDMPTNIFTKPLALPLFIKHRASLGLVSL